MYQRDILKVKNQNFLGLVLVAFFYDKILWQMPFQVERIYFALHFDGTLRRDVHILAEGSGCDWSYWICRLEAEEDEDRLLSCYPCFI